MSSSPVETRPASPSNGELAASPSTRDWLLVGACALAFLCAATYQLGLPGLHYDECIDAAAAVNFVRGTAKTEPMQIGPSTIRVFGRPFPVMLMTYIGPVKEALYIPLFSLFGISVTTVRVLPILAVLLYFPLTFLLCAQWFDRSVARLSVLLVALDPATVFYLTRDVGPAALQIVFKLMALLLLTAWWRSGRVAHLALASFVLGIGVSHKVDFLWVIVGVAVAVAATAQGVRRPRLRWRGAALSLLWFVVGATPIVVMNLLTRGATFAPLVARLLGHATTPGRQLLPTLATRLSQLFELLRGDFMGRLYAGEGLNLGVLGLAVPAVFVLSLVGLALLAKVRRSWLRPAVAIWIYLAVVLVETCFSPGALSGHHLLALWPGPQVVIALALAALASCAPLLARFGLHRGVIVAPLIANAWAVVAIHSLLARTGGKGAWSDSIYSVNDYLVGRGEAVVAVDWGFTLNLIVLSNGELAVERAYKEFWTKPISSATLSPFVEVNRLYLCHESGSEMWVGARDALLTAARDQGLEAREEAAFSTRDGTRVSSVLRLVTPPQEKARPVGFAAP